MLIFGFSLNMLTLLGLILAIGIVVDDAIVVVENVERIMAEERVTAREATHKAMRELSGALIATSMVLAAVFVPVEFLGGYHGAAVPSVLCYDRGFRAVVHGSALTLSRRCAPSSCVRLIRRKRLFSVRSICGWRKEIRNIRSCCVSLSLIPAVSWQVRDGTGGHLCLEPDVATSFIPEEDQGSSL